MRLIEQQAKTCVKTPPFRSPGGEARSGGGLGQMIRTHSLKRQRWGEKIGRPKERADSKAIAIENDLRATLRNFGLRRRARRSRRRSIRQIGVRTKARLRSGPSNFRKRQSSGASDRLACSVSALERFTDSSRTSPEVREWDGPAALPPSTVLRVRRGLVRKGAPPCPARPLFTQ
jgi:hypothetical protein